MRFGMELDTRNVQVFIFKTFDCLVIGIDKRDAGPFGKRVSIDCITMVLGSDKNPAVFKPHRLVRTAVTEFEFVGIAAKSKGSDLVTHAYPKNRKLANNSLYGIDCRAGGLWITRAVGDEETIGFNAEDIFGCCIVGEYIQVSIPVGETCEHIGFQAKVYNRDLLSASGDIGTGLCRKLPG